MGWTPALDWLVGGKVRQVDEQKASLIVVVGQFDADLFPVDSVPEMPSPVTFEDVAPLHAPSPTNVEQMCNGCLAKLFDINKEE